jgi:acetyl esterase/lipase
MRIEPRNVTLAEFPASRIDTEGIKIITADESRPSVHVTVGVEYARKSGIPLHLTILAPRLDEGRSDTFPLVMFVQGSAWLQQDLHQQLAQLAPYAAQGLVIAMVEYRPSTVSPFPAQVKDARSATLFMLDNAECYHADPKRLLLWGDSSGGHTVTMLAVTNGLAAFSDEETGPLPISGVIDYYGPNLLGTMNEEPSIEDHDGPDSPEGMVLGAVRVSEHHDRMKAASPLGYILPSKALPPFLILHGDKDRHVPFGQSVLLYRKLRECGHQVEMYKVAGADHSGNAFWTSVEAIKITSEFIRLCIS